MGNISVNIKPNGFSQADLVDTLYNIIASIKGICAKLDDDGTVTDTTYEALCYTAIFNTVIYNSRGSMTGLNGLYTITPTGLTNEALIALLYQIFDSWETLLEQLDADGTVNGTNYEALWYTATFLWKVTKGNGSSLGNGTSKYFGPISPPPDNELVDLLYAIVASIYGVCVKLDADSGVADTDYTALWFTAIFLLRIENSAGSTVGVAKTY